jgi:very-short-patch-repair endonuclease
MTQFYNRTSEKIKRQQLRRNMTKAESMVWSKISNRQIEGYKFRRQYSVERFILDFYCPCLKLAIEIDGNSHFLEDAQKYDRERQTFIESFGITFLRFTNEEVYRNLEGVVEKIKSQAIELSKLL